MSSEPEEPPAKKQRDSVPQSSYFDKTKLDKVRSGNKPASKKKIDSLLKFIGGFKYWDDLNEDCRQEVVKYLDYAERTKLGICSKRDYNTVEATPIDVHSVDIYENRKKPWMINRRESDNVVVMIQFPHYSGRNFTLTFRQLGAHTQISWTDDDDDDEDRNVVWKSCNYYETAVKFAEKWMKKCNFELKQILVSLSEYPFKNSIIKSLPKCVSIDLAANDVESFRWWLQKVPDQLRKVELKATTHQKEFKLPSELLDAPQIMQTVCFDCECCVDFTDEQFLNLKANKIRFGNASITDEGINQFITRWVNGNTFDFKEVHLWSNKDRNFSELTRGLEVTPWDEEFQREVSNIWQKFEYQRGYGTCVQIPNRVDPYESLTLCVFDGCLSISATGHRATSDGKAYTKYSIP